jgi:hypothetical protein
LIAGVSKPSGEWWWRKFIEGEESREWFRERSGIRIANGDRIRGVELIDDSVED